MRGKFVEFLLKVDGVEKFENLLIKTRNLEAGSGPIEKFLGLK